MCVGMWMIGYTQSPILLCAPGQLGQRAHYESALDLCGKAQKEISRARREHKHNMALDQELAMDSLVASHEAVQREKVS